MNLAQHVGDDPQHVGHNRALLTRALGLEALQAQPFWLNQVHSARGVCLESEEAALTATNGLGVDLSYSHLELMNPEEVHRIPVILTADCLPVLMTDSKGRMIMAVHAGWKGLAAGILQVALDLFLEHGIPRSELVVWIGPGIGPQAFVVGEEVHALFTGLNPDHQQAFCRHRDQWLGDLYRMAQIVLEAAGVLRQQIHSDYWCTYSDPQRFFSYRREGQTGRMATLIWRCPKVVL